MTDLEKNLSTFCSESAVYIALYFAFALVVCSVLAGLEFVNQSSSVGLFRVSLRAAGMLLFSSVLFTLALYITSWHSKSLGGDVLTFLVVVIAWTALAYLFNGFLLERIGLTFETPTLYNVVPTAVLVSPFIAFNGFVFVLGSRWGI